mgnify:CR=1 FL=1
MKNVPCWALLALLLLLVACSGGEEAGPAGAAAPGDAMPARLVFSVVSEENQSDRQARFELFREYLEERLGVPVELHLATDYAGTIEAMKASKVDLAFLGPAAYASAWEVTGGNVEPLLTYVDNEGGQGYHSVVAVAAGSPFTTLEDLRGKSMAFPDPNSASGYLVPAYHFRRMGIDIAEYFSRTGFSGNHENGILAVLSGDYDAATTFWNNEQMGNIQRMEEKGMIPAGSTRLVWKSPLIPNEAWTIRKDLPTVVRESVLEALAGMREQAPEAWERLTDGKVREYIPATHAMYEDTILMRQENLKERRGK